MGISQPGITFGNLTIMEESQSHIWESHNLEESHIWESHNLEESHIWESHNLEDSHIW